MYCIFLSDAHLKGADDPNQHRLAAFLDGLSPERPDKVFLLGDIFDFWVSTRGRVDPAYRDLIDALGKLNERGIKLYYHIGNHDFFTKSVFKKKFTEMDIAENGKEIELDNVRCFITHGDMIDYTDTWYRILRFILRSRFARVLTYILPSVLIGSIAARLSKRSREVWTKKRTLPDHVLDEYMEKKASQGYDAVIAAHFHEPVIREYTFNRKKIRYINTGNWFSAYSYVVFRDGVFDLKYYGTKV